MPIILVLLILSSPISRATIYKWIDEQGNTHYGSVPQKNARHTEKIQLREKFTTHPRISKEDVAIERSNQQEAELEKRKQAAAEPPKPAPLSRSERTRLCKQAQRDVAGIRSRGRMRERNTHGEYIYLSEPQRQQRLRAAQSRQKKYC